MMVQQSAATFLRRFQPVNDTSAANAAREKRGAPGNGTMSRRRQ
jgi:hypothetical protein